MMPTQTARRVSSAQRVALAIGILVALVGAGHLAAWLSGAMAAAFGASAITVKTNASVCLTLAGLALALLASTDRALSLRLTARAFATVVLIVGALTLVEHLAGVNLGLDQLLATERPGAAAVVSPNRMGPPASSCFTLLGTGLLLLSRAGRSRRSRIAHQPVAAAAAVVALLPVIGYLYSVDELYGVARFTGIAWPTGHDNGA